MAVKKDDQAAQVADKARELVSRPSRAVPLEPGEPEKVASVMGATFAERAAASKKAVAGGRAENKAAAGGAEK